MRNEASTRPEGGPFPWQRGWTALKTVWPQLLYISIAAIAIPQFGIFTLFALRAWDFGRTSGEADTLMELLALLEGFAIAYFSFYLLGLILAAIAYLSLVAAVREVQEGRPAQTWTALRQGLRAFFPGGLFALVLILLLGLGLVQFLVIVPALGFLAQFFLIAFTVLLSALPVLLCLEPRAPARALSQALRMAYVEQSGVSRWSAFFMLLTYEMSLMALLSLLRFGKEQLAALDLALHLPRQVWFVTSSWMPFGLTTWMIEGLFLTLLSLLVGTFAIFTSSFIFDLRQMSQRSGLKIELLV